MIVLINIIFEKISILCKLQYINQFFNVFLILRIHKLTVIILFSFYLLIYYHQIFLRLIYQLFIFVYNLIK